MTIIDVLRPYYQPIGLAGAKPLGQRLNADLQQHYRLNVRMHIFILCLLLVAFGGVGAFVATHALESKDMAAIIAALCAFATALIELARRVTREWSQAKLLTSVMHSLSDEQKVALVSKLIENAKP